MKTSRLGLLLGLSLCLSLLLASAALASYPGKNGKIFFEAATKNSRGDFVSGIVSIRPNGRGFERLTRKGEETPTVSPDGTHVAFERARGGSNTNTDIWVMNSDGSGQKRLTSLAGHEFLLQWLPDGQIAFERRPADLFIDNEPFNGPNPFWAMNADGSGQRVSVEDERPPPSSCGPVYPDGTFERCEVGPQFVPTWSPDGRTIAYAASYGDNTYVWTMNADGTNRRIITPDSSAEQDGRRSGPVDWTPDGSRILIFSDPGGYGTIDLQGASITPIPIKGSPPSFSPDGNWIVYTGKGGLRVARANGSDSRIIYKGSPSLEIFDPVWQPR